MMLLSLAMIVKNEALSLPEFFNHHRPLFDEMVVVDTGSDDGTPEVCRQAGALLLEEPWRDDFSSPRNQGLARARGRWVMILDADEKISASDFATLRSYLQQAEPTICLQETINYFPDNRHLEWQPVTGRYPREEKGQTGFFSARRAGLFINDPGLEFSGRVHESILPSAQRLGLPVRLLPLPVHHFGYVRDPLKNQARRERYRQLGARKLKDDPDNGAAQLELAAIELEDNQPLAARLRLEKMVAGQGQSSEAHRARYLLARLQREAGQPDSARQLLESATTGQPDLLFAWLEWIRLEADRGAWQEAARVLDRAKGAFPSGNPLLMREELPVLAHLGRMADALQVARALARICPQWLEINNLVKKMEGLTGL